MCIHIHIYIYIAFMHINTSMMAGQICSTNMCAGQILRFCWFLAAPSLPGQTRSQLVGASFIIVLTVFASEVVRA